MGQFLASQGGLSCSTLHIFLNVFSKSHLNDAKLSYNAKYMNDFSVDQYIL